MKRSDARQQDPRFEGTEARAIRQLEMRIRAKPRDIPALTAPEVVHFERCESILQRGLHTFFEVGIALLTIRDERLYRVDYPSFESYCKERWGIGRSYAWRLMGAAERLKLLPDDGTLPKPTSEFQVRPFLKIEPQLFQNHSRTSKIVDR